jgi:hypothetical protein
MERVERRPQSSLLSCLSKTGLELPLNVTHKQRGSIQPTDELLLHELRWSKFRPGIGHKNFLFIMSGNGLADRRMTFRAQVVGVIHGASHK